LLTRAGAHKQKVEKDKGLMSAVNWARVHRSNFPGDNNSEEEEDQNAVKVFARNEQGNWSVPDLKVGHPSPSLFNWPLCTTTSSC
jgi:hypothetical protein